MNYELRKKRLVRFCSEKAGAVVLKNPIGDEFIMSFFTELIQRVRRNHGLEHATIHVLSEKFRNFGAQGNAANGGFYLNLFGNIEPEAVEAAAYEALERMKKGEERLALHPNCGTVLLTTATMVTLAGQAVFTVEEKRSGRKMDALGFMNALPGAILAVVLTIVASRPVGMYFQSFTTTGKMGEMRIKEVRKLNTSPIAHFFRVLLGRNKKVKTTSYFIATEG